MDTGHPGGFDHVLVLGAGIEPGDVLGDGAGQHLDALRQVADIAAQLARVPLVERGAVKPDLAQARLPDPGEQPRQARFAGGAVAHHRQPVAGMQLEAEAFENPRPVADRLPLRRQLGQVDHLEMALGPRQVDPGFRRGQGIERQFQPLMRLAGPTDRAPVPDHLVDRRQRPAGDDRGGDDHPRRDFLAQRQQRPEGKQRRLQQQPEGFRKRRKQLRPVAAGLVARQRGAVHVAPARGDRIQHPEGKDGLGIAPGMFDERAFGAVARAGLADRPVREQPVQYRRDDHDPGAQNRQPAEPGMDEEDDGQKDRNPGQIEHAKNRGAAQEAAHDLEIAHRVVMLAVLDKARAQPEPEGLRAHILVDQVARPRQQLGAQNLVDAEKAVEHHHDDEQLPQGGHRAARQHPVIDLQHVERAGQHQHVDRGTEEPDRQERPAQTPQRGAIRIYRLV